MQKSAFFELKQFPNNNKLNFSFSRICNIKDCITKFADQGPYQKKSLGSGSTKKDERLRIQIHIKG